ncbi:MAG: hypothetical protein F6K09_33700 [Merismopedia sp. SIO2A8]|nr:hypothetical protein [Merismopedia sp. SIO2A8]
MPFHRTVYAAIRASFFLLGSIAITNCSSTATNEAIQDIFICPYNEVYRCDGHTREFLDPPSIVMINADIADITDGSTITVEWNYGGGEFEAMDIQTTTFEKSNADVISMYAILTQPDGGWPTGTYEVVLSTDSTAGKITQPFSIFNSNPGANSNSSTQPNNTGGTTDTAPSRSAKLLQDVVLCQLDALDADGNCLSELSIVPKSSPGVRVEAAIPTAPVGTTVVINWRYINEAIGRSQDIQTVTRLKDDSTVNQIDVRLGRPTDGWQSGTYEVVLTIPANNSEIERKQFIVQ